MIQICVVDTHLDLVTLEYILDSVCYPMLEIGYTQFERCSPLVNMCYSML